MEQRRAATAGFIGCAAWAVGILWITLDEFEYTGAIDRNPIPSWLGFAIGALGSAGFIIALIAFHETHKLGMSSMGRWGYGTTLAGLALLLVPIWPLIFFGPLVVGVGVTAYGIERYRLGGSAASGASLHAAFFPIAVIAGIVASFAGGKPDAVGGIAALAIAIGGFAVMSYSLLRPALSPAAGAAPALGGAES
jgi:hypothetical protein